MLWSERELVRRRQHAKSRKRIFQLVTKVIMLLQEHARMGFNQSMGREDSSEDYLFYLRLEKLTSRGRWGLWGWKINLQ